MTQIKANVKGCVHVQHTISNINPNSDMCYVKERVFREDGSSYPSARLIKNAKRPWYMTIKEKQNHKSKKEWERKNYLRKFEVNQAQLTKQIASVLGCRPMGLRQLNQNPYIYGTDITIQSIIKNKYDKASAGHPIVPTSAFCDFEWDVDGLSNVSLGQYVFNDDVYILVRKDLVKDHPNAVTEIRKLADETYWPYIDQWYDLKNIASLEKHAKDFIGDREPRVAFYDIGDMDERIKFFAGLKDKSGNPIEYKRRRNYKLNVLIVDDAYEVASKTIERAHIDKPDYLLFWNGQADMEALERTARNFGVDWSEFMCDTTIKIPPEFRNTRFVEGQKEKPDANGNPKKVDPQDRWHSLYNMAPWMFTDLMATYSANRMHLPNKPYYTLDYTLNSELGLAKFKFKGMLDPAIDNLEGAEWHRQMVARYPIHYCVYGLGDIIPMQILEDELSDIAGQLYPKLGISPLDNFKKNPRRLCDAMHFILEEKGYIIGSTSNQMLEVFDQNIYKPARWIITLNSDLHYGMESCSLLGLPEVKTTNIAKVGDGDITSSYPSTCRFLNTSKATTYSEICNIAGLDELDARELGMNISAGKGAAYDVCTRGFNYPHYAELSRLWDECEKESVINGELVD